MSARFVSILACFVAPMLGVTVGWAQEPLGVRPEQVLELDMQIDSANPIVVPPAAGADVVSWRQEVRARLAVPGAAGGIRVHVHFNTRPAGVWSLHFMTGAGVEVERVGAAQLSPSGDVWSDEVSDTVAIVELRKEATGQTPGATIDYAYHVIPTRKQSITEPNQLMPIGDAPLRVRKLSKPVARLRFIIPGKGEATCTAFVVGKRLMLTNQHCIENADAAKSAVADFNYDRDGSEPTRIRVDCIVATNPDLDYTLIRLIEDPPAEIGRLFFAPSVPAPPDLLPVFIIQHPSGLPKHVSIADCHIAGLDKVGVARDVRSDFGHLCDTLGGSSGSPVLDWKTGLIVGLHHFGFLAGVTNPVNQAVYHARILADIQGQDAAACLEVAARPGS